MNILESLIILFGLWIFVGEPLRNIANELRKIKLILENRLGKDE